ncbi:MAG: hypothetical protein ABIQ01_01885 [Pseudolysinimonas sp.]
MTIALRIALALVALDELVVGAWNQFAPGSFYANFPTVGLTPPFSEHFARDFGGATLGIAVLLIVAFVRPRGGFVLPAGIAYTVFSVPHLVFHASHLEHASVPEAAFLLVGNGLSTALGILVIVLRVVAMTRDRRSPHPDLRDPVLG